MSTTSPTTDHALPAATPSVLAALLAAAVVFATLPRGLGAAGVKPALLAFALAGVLCLIAPLRHALPAAPGPVSGVLWLLAGVLGAAVLGRGALEALFLAWADFPADAPALPGVDRAGMVLLGALLLPAGILGLASRLRSPRPALLVPALLGLAPLALLVGRPSVPRGWPGELLRAWPEVSPALPIVFALAWATLLPGPAALPLSRRRLWAHHVVPPLVAALVVAVLPALLVASASASAPPVAALWTSGRRVFGGYGGEVAAGLQCLLLLVAAQVLVILSARVAARSLPLLRSAVFPLMAIAAGLLATWWSLGTLLMLSAGFGWLAVLWGTEPDGATPPPLVSAPSP